MINSKKTVSQLLSLLTFDHAQVDFADEDDIFNINITLPPEESGILIGYRGEKIDALQFVINIMLNQSNISYKPVQLDINDYRQRRHQSLFELADKASQKAIESGKEILLPPLPSHERRVIHMHLSENPNVTTYSEGEGGGRRIVVRPE